MEKTQTGNVLCIRGLKDEIINVQDLNLELKLNEK